MTYLLALYEVKLLFMKYTGVVFIGLFILIIAVAGCKASSKTQAQATSAVDVNEQKTEPVSDIALYDKPLDTIKKHVVGYKWELIHSIGGMTGRDRNTFDSTYYTLKEDGKMIMERKGDKKVHPYEWKQMRDIYTGDSIYVISGVVQWKVNGIDNDTLRVLDNYVDGYTYSLVRVK